MDEGLQSDNDDNSFITARTKKENLKKKLKEKKMNMSMSKSEKLKRENDEEMENSLNDKKAAFKLEFMIKQA